MITTLNKTVYRHQQQEDRMTERPGQRNRGNAVPGEATAGQAHIPYQEAPEDSSSAWVPATDRLRLSLGSSLAWPNPGNYEHKRRGTAEER